jgi:menaquinone-dependent protoporphyrinogen oxidase
MARLLIAHGSTEGHTARIADVIGDVVRSRGHDAEVVDIDALDVVALGHYDAVMLGASVHRGRHDKGVVAFARAHHEALDLMPSAFFSVSLAAAGGDTEEAETYVDEFEDETGWRPDRVAKFGGALPYTHYGFLKRHLMRRIVESKPGHLGLDTSQDYVYTEWDAVAAFAEHFVEQVEAASA